MRVRAVRSFEPKSQHGKRFGPSRSRLNAGKSARSLEPEHGRSDWSCTAGEVNHAALTHDAQQSRKTKQCCDQLSASIIICELPITPPSVPRAVSGPPFGVPNTAIPPAAVLTWANVPPNAGTFKGLPISELKLTAKVAAESCSP